MTGKLGQFGSIEERLSNSLSLAENGCWLWEGYLDPSGYGRIKHGTLQYAHRLMWALENGPIPKGMVVRHLCDNRRCCNPEHLAIGTHKDNSQDRERAYKAGAFPLYHY